MSKSSDSGRAYHTECTGPALETVNAHKGNAEITLFGSCFCPFVQRVWVTFEILGIPYKYYEVDPYKKPKELLEISPKGLVPALHFDGHSNPPRSLNESTVIIDFLEDVAATTTHHTLLPLPTNPYARALARLTADHINRNLIPAFYRYLQAQDTEAQIAGGKEFHGSLEGFASLLDRTEREIVYPGGQSGEGEKAMIRRGLGLWIEGNHDLGWADVMASPWLFRAKIVLSHYRGFQFPEGKKFNSYLERLFNHPKFVATCSDEQLYFDSYERYAFNRPNTSQVAKAINEGKTLP